MVSTWYGKRQVTKLSVGLAQHKVPMAQERVSTAWLNPVTASTQGLPTCHVPPSFAYYHALELMPMASHACADLIHLYYPTLELGARYEDLGQQQGRRRGGAEPPGDRNRRKDAVSHL